MSEYTDSDDLYEHVDPNEALIDRGIELFQRAERLAAEKDNQAQLRGLLQEAASLYPYLPSPERWAAGDARAVERDETGAIPADRKNLRAQAKRELQYMPDPDQARFRAAAEGIDEVKVIASGSTSYLEAGIYLTAGRQAVEYGITPKGELTEAISDEDHVGFHYRLTDFSRIGPLLDYPDGPDGEAPGEWIDIRVLIERLRASVAKAKELRTQTKGRGFRS